MEDDNNWHYRTPNNEELENALKEIEQYLQLNFIDEKYICKSYN